jgi:hypothetical protein
MSNSERIAEFEMNAEHASFHHADDSGKEWGLAKPYECRCQEIYDAGDEELRAAIRKIKGRFLISIRTN